MTLIAGLRVNDYPVLISDFLVVQKGQFCGVGENNKIPTLLNSSSLLLSGNYKIMGMMKKIEIINDNFVISWAGNIFKAFGVIRKIKAKFSVMIPTNNAIRELIGEQPDIQFIWIFKSEDGFEQGCYNAKKIPNNNYFDEIIIGGSANKTIEEADDFFINKNKAIAEEDVVVDAVCSCLYMFSHLTNHELIMSNNAATLNDRFGGGYDLVCFYDEKFQRISDITYLFLDSSFNTDTECISIDGSGVLIKQVNNDNTIKLKRINFNFIETLNGHTLLTKMNKVDNYDLSLKMGEGLGNIDFLSGLESSFLCIITRFDSLNGHHCYIRKYSDYISAARKSIQFKCVGKLMMMEFNKVFFSDYSNELLAFYKG